MNRIPNQSHFDQLRKKYPYFVFQNYSIQDENGSLKLKFNFNLANQFFFEPQIEIPARSFLDWKALPGEALEQLAFNIGMVELISYWKAACPPLLIVKPFRLDTQQVNWWKKLYYHGLGEFFYLNGIHTGINDFMEIRSEGNSPIDACDMLPEQKAVVPVGGGKDSVVTLELLKKFDVPYFPFIINPRHASLGCAFAAGFHINEIAIVDRKLDPLLLKLNEQGFLNGHTPFSALIAFVAALVAAGSGSQYVILSNESSANEATVEGTMVNHQYSKSLAFERDFRVYSQKYLIKHVEYFSLLRPLNELQIGSLFSRYPIYFEHFKSCNVGSKTDSWCCKCPKCLFTWLMLSPFVAHSRLKQIFGCNLMADTGLLPIMSQLAGHSHTKPFECVGTVEEVNAAIWNIAHTDPKRDAGLIHAFRENFNKQNQTISELAELLSHFDDDHFLPDLFIAKLKEVVND